MNMNAAEPGTTKPLSGGAAVPVQPDGNASLPQSLIGIDPLSIAQDIQREQRSPRFRKHHYPRLARLPVEQMAQLIRWLVIDKITYSEARTRLNGWGIDLSINSISVFWIRCISPRLIVYPPGASGIIYEDSQVEIRLRRK
ncbi:MAG: hypothetical protein QOF48_1517 [Verrucomicrobiota bacterium]|jgi:hypothetical protein